MKLLEVIMNRDVEILIKALALIFFRIMNIY